MGEYRRNPFAESINMTPATEQALKVIAPSLRMFARNGRWGTCADCPVDREGNQYPEFCLNTERHDHHLDMKALHKQWDTNIQIYEKRS